MPLDLSGLQPLDTSGLREEESAFDLGGLTPLDVSGLTEAEPESEFDSQSFARRNLINPLKTGGLRLLEAGAAGSANTAAGRLETLNRIDQMEAAGRRQEALDEAARAGDPDIGQYAAAFGRQDLRDSIRAKLSGQVGRGVSGVVQAEQSLSEIPKDPRLQKAIESGNISELGGAIWDDPGILWRLAVESAPLTAPALVAAPVAGPVAGAALLGANSYLVESSMTLLEEMRAAGIDTRDPEALRAGFANPELMAKARETAAAKGLPVALFDAVSGGVASKVLAPARVAGRELGAVTREGVNVAAQMPAQATLGAAGEAAGQVAAYGEIKSPVDIALEAAGEFGTAPIEVASMAKSAGRELGGGQTQAAPARPTVQVAGQLVAVATPERTLDGAPVVVAPPNVTADDVRSPLPTDMISEGRRIVEEAAGGLAAPSLPRGAVAAETVIGAEPAPLTRAAEPSASSLPDTQAPPPPNTQAPPPNAAPTVDLSQPLPPNASMQEILDRIRQIVAEPMTVPATTPATTAPVSQISAAVEAPMVPQGTFEPSAPVQPAALSVEGLTPIDSGPAITMAPAAAPAGAPVASAPLPATPAPVSPQAAPAPAFAPPAVEALPAVQQSAPTNPPPAAPDAGPAPTFAPTGALPKPKRQGRPLSLIQFLASQGGIQDQGGDLAALDLTRRFVPRYGRLVRKGGLTLDRARQLAEDEGYIRPSDQSEQFGRTEITDLLNALDEEARGNRVFAAADQGRVAAEGLDRTEAARADQQAQEEEGARAEIEATAKRQGVKLSEAESAEAVRLMLTEGLPAEDAIAEAVDASWASTEPALADQADPAQSVAPQEISFDADTSAEVTGSETDAAPGRPAEGVDPGAADRGAPAGREPGSRQRDAGEAQGESTLSQGAPDPDAAPFQRPRTEKTPQGDQFVLPGTTKVQDDGGKLRGEGRQKPADEGLFAPKEKDQGSLFRRPAPPEAPDLPETTEDGRQLFYQRVGNVEVGYVPTEALTENEQAVIAEIEAIVERLAPKATVAVSQTVYGVDEKGPFRVTGAFQNRKWQAIIFAALQRVEGDPSVRNTVFHEIVHALRRGGFINDLEWSVLSREAERSWIAKHRIEERYPGASRELMIEEAIAEEFAAWMEANERHGNSVVQRAFSRIASLLNQVRQFLAGRGITTVEEAFQRIASGEVGRREPAAEGAGGGTLQAAFQNPLATTSEDRQQVAQSFLAKGQPIDRAIRLPFEWFGGLNEKGEYKPGVYLSKKAGEIITSAEFSDTGRFSFLNPLLRAARAGLVDRYGLDPAYVEREYKRGLDERRIMAQVPDILQTLAESDIRPEEMQILQAVLTGEQVPDARWSQVAAPIRAAIDQMGAEAVEMGLLSQESYERNRGKYLHRVYQKHEADTGALAKWVSRLMAGRRQKIIGDQFKGRGMFLEVSAAPLLRHTDEAQALKKDSGTLRLLEKRRADLLRRLEVAMARADERTDESAATMDRRMDTSEDARVALERPAWPAPTKVVLRPQSFQKGQAREHGEALNRLRNKTEQAAQMIQRLEAQIGETERRVVNLETRMFAAGDVVATKGQRFRILDQVEDGKVRDRAYLPEGAAVPTRYQGYVDKGVWEVRGSTAKDGRGKTVLWRDFTKAERTQMGEIVDARYTIAKTYMLMAHDLASGRFFKDIAGHPEWSRADQPPDGTWKDASEYRFGAIQAATDTETEWVRVPDAVISGSNTKRYGALAGKFVRAEIWRDLSEMEAMQKPGLWNTLLRQWKLNKTARSPVTHMNNVMSNLVLMDMADVRSQDLVAGIRSMVTKDALYREAVDNGAFGSDMVAQDIRQNVLEPILQQITNTAQGDQGPLEARIGLLGKVADGIWSGFRKVDDKMLQLYQLEDEVFRMALFARRRGQGIPADQAGIEARDQFLNYDIRAPWVNAARRTVLPFISYTYRAVPLIARTVATRPWKIAKYAAIMYGLNALAYGLTGGDEDEERRSLREQEQGRAWMGTPRMVRMPWNDSLGNPVFLDVRRWIPVGDVFDTGQGSGAVPMPSWLQFGGPLQLGAELALNRSSFTGKDITNKLTDTWFEKEAKVAGYLYQQWMPSAAWIPGSFYNTRIWDAVTGARDWQGRPYSVPQAVASSVGIKVKPQDVDEGFQLKAMEFERVERDLKTQMSRLGKDRELNRIGEASYERQKARIIEKLGGLDKQRETDLKRSAR